MDFCRTSTGIIMTYTVTLTRSGDSFSVRDGLTLLDEAMAAGYVLDYSCKSGSCGRCKVKLSNGAVTHATSASAISESEIAAGYALSCCAYPESDLELDVEFIPELAQIKVLTLPCLIDSITRLADDVISLLVHIPEDSAFRFLPGQYVQFIRGDLRRSYSIAGLTGNRLEFHVRCLADGVFSQYLCHNARPGDLLHLEGPFGTFVLRDRGCPIIFIAGGTGIVPILAMLNELTASQITRQISVYWGASTIDGFYSDRVQSLTDAGYPIRYKKIYSGSENSWKGDTGLVHEAVLRDFSDLSDYNVYACGPQPMIKIAEREFSALGLQPGHFYSDVFVAA